MLCPFSHLKEINAAVFSRVNTEYHSIGSVSDAFRYIIIITCVAKGIIMHTCRVDVAVL